MIGMVIKWKKSYMDQFGQAGREGEGQEGRFDEKYKPIYYLFLEDLRSI